MSKYIVLDLDNTVIFSSESTNNNANLVFDDGSKYECFKRPGFDKFMDYIDTHMTAVFVWSAGSPDYVAKVIESMFPYRPNLVWASDRCERKKDIDENMYPYIKPLEAIYRHMQVIYPHSWNEDELYNPDSFYPNMFNTIMLDDRHEIAVDNKHNHIQVKPFEGDVNDTELTRVTSILNGWKDNMTALDVCI